MKDKKFIYTTLMTIRNFDDPQHIEESMKEIISFCCDYYHIKKGYKDEHGTWNENLNFTLLKVWVSEKTGWEYTNKEKWTRTHGYKAYLKFDMEKEE